MNLNNIDNNNIITDPVLLPNGFNSPNFINSQEPSISPNDSELLNNNSCICPPESEITNNIEPSITSTKSTLANNIQLNITPSKPNSINNIQLNITPTESNSESINNIKSSISPIDSDSESINNIEPSISPTESVLLNNIQPSESTDLLNNIASTKQNKIERNNEKLKKIYDKLPDNEKKSFIIKNEIMEILPLSLLIVLLIFILLLIYILTF